MINNKTIASSFGEHPVILSPKKQAPDTCERISDSPRRYFDNTLKCIDVIAH